MASAGVKTPGWLGKQGPGRIVAEFRALHREIAAGRLPGVSEVGGCRFVAIARGWVGSCMHRPPWRHRRRQQLLRQAPPASGPRRQRRQR